MLTSRAGDADARRLSFMIEFPYVDFDFSSRGGDVHRAGEAAAAAALHRPLISPTAIRQVASRLRASRHQGITGQRLAEMRLGR